MILFLFSLHLILNPLDRILQESISLQGEALTLGQSQSSAGCRFLAAEACRSSSKRQEVPNYSSQAQKYLRLDLKQAPVAFATSSPNHSVDFLM